MGIVSRPYGKTEEGGEAHIFTLTNSKGMTAEITDFGGTIVSLNVPDGQGRLEDVALGYGGIEDYLKKGPYFGALIGRHGNRIENAEFELNGKLYRLSKNEGENQLHGGTKGFDKKLWNAVSDEGGLELTYRSVDGEEGYPGNLDVKVNYSLTEDNALRIDYFAVSDADTVVNLTNHCYFNLSGHASGDITGHELRINAESFTVIDGNCIPTGEIRGVRDTPMDFTVQSPIGPGLSSGYEQIEKGGGYDHNYVLNVSGNSPEKAAEVYDPASGRVMEVYTTKPGVQFYSGNFLDGADTGKGGAVYGKWSGLCLETQYFPNSMKHRHFPSPVLKAGKEYRHTTIYRFSNR